MMKPIYSDPETDLAPMLFDERIRKLALDMKSNGLGWKPHVGCFVSDPDYHINPDSPFPGRVYFILSLSRFIELLGSKDAISEELVWLPTWHQDQLICRRIEIADDMIMKDREPKSSFNPCEDLVNVYLCINDTLSKLRKDR